MNSPLPVSPRALLRVLLWTLVWPLLALLGAAIWVAAALRALRSLLRAARALRETLRCPRGHENPVIGRWSCDQCGGEYLGWVGGCEICGDESADWFACRTCSLAIPLPWRLRS